MSSNSQTSNTSNTTGAAGFSLIEVLIAMAIMVMISIGIYQAVTQTFRLRDELSTEGDFYNGLRLAMSVLDRDITLMYSPIILLKTPQKSSAVRAAEPPPDARDLQAIIDGSQTTQYWGAVTDKTFIRPSRFVGAEAKITFISASHTRMYKDAQESLFAKVSYELQKEETAETQVLVRSASPNVYEDDDRKDKYWRKFQLIRGLRKLKFRYYRKDKDRWETSWDSDKEDQKNLYPDTIEVTFEATYAVTGKRKLSFDGIYHFRPEVPFRGLAPRT